MNKLSKLQWGILDSLVDQDEPFEAIYNSLKDININIEPNEMLEELFNLYKSHYITIKQIPITPLGQNFKKKNIEPFSPTEILGDLEQYYHLYCEKKDYLWKFDAGNTGSSAGIPFGIWIDITEKGRTEWENPSYKEYYPED